MASGSSRAWVLRIFTWDVSGHGAGVGPGNGAVRGLYACVCQGRDCRRSCVPTASGAAARCYTCTMHVQAQCDVLLVGGGHNGLVCAAYLARAGLTVTVLERRGVVGGAAVTEEFHPGFRNSVAAYTVSLLQPKVIEELDLHGHGLRIVLRRRNNFLPL